METKKNYIDGEWMDALSKKTTEIRNPATQELLALTAEGDASDAELAIAAAKRAFYKDKQGFRRMGSQKRSELLYQLADALKKNSEEFARIETMNNGKPLREALCDVDDAVAYIKYYAGAIHMPSGMSYELGDGFGPMQAFSVKEPVGVCALITPWNYPLLMGVQKIAPALAAGNTVVFKPSSSTPLSTVRLFELMDALSFPKGTVNLVMGPGGVVGTELAKSHDVDMLSFTGSTSVGQRIYRAAAGNLKKIGLELGGKSPNIIFADSDIDGAVEWAMMGAFFNQGEVCSAGARILVEESIEKEFVHKLCKRAEAITLGNGLQNPDMGPLVSETHMKKVLGYIEKAKEEGCHLVCGGYRFVEGECEKGFFVKPTIFTNCKAENTIVKEEIFGPVVSVQSFKTEQEAVEMANDTEYGLAGSVFTKDGARALRVVNEIRAGITWINCCNTAYIETPWGGYKKSGIGRELGIHGLEEYQETKQVTINLSPGELGWYEKR